MREISPAANVSADDFLREAPTQTQHLVSEMRRQKEDGTRPRPSTKLVDHSTLLTKTQRERLLDAVANLVDENLSGRSEMCIQFADLLKRALAHLGFSSRSVVGWAIYYSEEGQEIFRWKHAWIRVDGEGIDGNVDSLFENPMVPRTVNVAPYWGPIADIPDRRLREEHGSTLPLDRDDSEIWWPELRTWLDKEFREGA